MLFQRDRILKIISYVVLACITCFNSSSWAQGKFDINVRFQKLTIEDGLSQEVVNSIYQDQKGYLWFGTQEGLNRYDGYHFENFNQEFANHDALPDDWVSDIQEDANGNLWIATDGGGLAMFNELDHVFVSYRNNVDNPQSLNSDTVRVLFLDSRNDFWVGTDNGLDKFQAENDLFETVNIAPTPSSELPSPLKVRAVVEDKSGLLWVGTDGSGLYSFDSQTGNVSHYYTAQNNSLIPSNRIDSLLVDSDNRLWVGTYDSGLAIIDSSRTNASFYTVNTNKPDSLSHNQVRDIFEDSNNAIWLATDNGLDRWLEDSQTFAHYRYSPENPFSLSNNKVNTLFQDKGNVLWVGTFSGISKWNMATAAFGHIFKQSENDKSLLDNGVNAFEQSKDGTLWVGTYGGLNAFHQRTGDITYYNRGETSDLDTHLNEDRVMSLYSDGSGNLWIGTRAAGLSKLDIATGRFEHFTTQSSEASKISSDMVTTITANSDGNLLIGTWEGGLNVLNPTTREFTHYQNEPDNKQSLSSDKVLAIYITQDDKIWVGTWGGGITILNSDLSTYKVVRMDFVPGSLSEDSIWTILEDSSHNIWIGTQGGGISLLRAENRELENFRFERIGRNQGLPSTVVYGLMEASDGAIWASTNRGISKINPQDLSILNYDASVGLQGNEFSSGAYFKDREGYMYFGGSNGFTLFKPEDITANSHVPPVVITEYATLNKRSPLSDRLDVIDELEIRHQDYLVSFSFAALDFAEPTKNQYTYKLEGFDREWLYTDEIRKATYTNLPAGHYVFKVKASNNDGVWNEDGASVRVKVLSPMWQTWWANTIYVLAALLLLTMLLLAYRNKLQRARYYHQELENEVGKRTKELTDLNEQLYTANTADPLSGLKNRIYLLSILEKEVADIHRKIYKAKKQDDQDLSIGPRVFFLMVDLDKFRDFNEKNDTGIGDNVIREMGEILSGFFRTSDTVVRWGGDQFLIVGQIDDIREVNRIADRLQQKVKSHCFTNKRGGVSNITCSLGFSLYPFYTAQPESMNWQQVQKIAHEAMLISKRAGRDTWTGLKEGKEMITEDDIPLLNKNYQSLVRAGKLTVVEFHSYAKKFF